MHCPNSFCIYLCQAVCIVNCMWTRRNVRKVDQPQLNAKKHLGMALQQLAWHWISNNWMQIHICIALQNSISTEHLSRGHSQPLSSSSMTTCRMTTCRTPQYQTQHRWRTHEFLTHLDITQSAWMAITGLEWHFMSSIAITNRFVAPELFTEITNQYLNNKWPCNFPAVYTSHDVHFGGRDRHKACCLLDTN